MSNNAVAILVRPYLSSWIQIEVSVVGGVVKLVVTNHLPKEGDQCVEPPLMVTIEEKKEFNPRLEFDRANRR